MLRPSLIGRCRWLLLACLVSMPAAAAVVANGTTGPSRAGANAKHDGAAPAREPPDAGAPADGAASADGRGETLPASALATARTAMSTLAHGVQSIERIRTKAPRDGFSTNCVTEKLAEARIGIQLGDQEMARLEAGLSRHDPDDAAYALRRLQLLVERSTAVVKAARSCADEDSGGVTATQVEVEVSPTLPEGDPTTPPLPQLPDMRPANDGR